MEYPNPCFQQINLDLRRTFFELKIEKSESLIEKLRNVLTVYTKRNPTIGYCQGMNFLVGRLLRTMQIGENDTDGKMKDLAFKIQDDENLDEMEAFWIFVMMMETMLPIDYYSNMVGVVIDQKIFYDLFRARMPELSQHLESVGFDPSLLAF